MRTEIVKTTCDRCGKEMPDWYNQYFSLYKRKRKFTLTKGPYSEEKEMDICEDCYNSLSDWFHRKGENK